MFGTCENCEATCVRVFLVNRGDETGLCARCVHRVYNRTEACCHPGLLPSMDAPHPRTEPEAYAAWLDRPKRCTNCNALVPERDL